MVSRTKSKMRPSIEIAAVLGALGLGSLAGLDMIRSSPSPMPYWRPGKNRTRARRIDHRAARRKAKLKAKLRRRKSA